MKTRVPKLRLHKTSGRAYVRVSGRFIYFGQYGTAAASTEYKKFLAKWAAEGKEGVLIQQTDEDFTIVELTAKYLVYADTYYRSKKGKRTTQYDIVVAAVRGLIELYGDTPVVEFTPSCFRIVREAWLEKDLARTTINKYGNCIKQMFKWGVSYEMLPVVVYETLSTVENLKEGRSRARDTEKVTQVPQEDVECLKPFVSRQVWALMWLQIYCGAREGELVGLRGVDIDMSGDVWEYRPVDHKNAWRGKERAIFFGPRCQEILKPFLQGRARDRYLFSPRDAVAERVVESDTHRRNNQKPTRRKTSRVVGACYTPTSYRRAVTRACEKAKVPRFTPNQLRHTAGTAMRKVTGVENSRVLLGHTTIKTSEIYAEIDEEKLRALALEFG